MKLVIKGAVGKFQFGLNSDCKCDWYVVDRETGEVVDRAENMSTASSRANYHNTMSRFSYEEKKEMGWV